jgi:hypothetical protein
MQDAEDLGQKKKGMVLPFKTQALTFDSIIYSVDMPAVSIQSSKEDQIT